MATGSAVLGEGRMSLHLKDIQTHMVGKISERSMSPTMSRFFKGKGDNVQIGNKKRIHRVTEQLDIVSSEYEQGKQNEGRATRAEVWRGRCCVSELALGALRAMVQLLSSHSSRKTSPHSSLLMKIKKTNSVETMNRGVKMCAVTIAKDALIQGSLIDEEILPRFPEVG